MKKLFFSLFSLVFLSADEIERLTREAEIYEQAGDYKNAMLLYKKAAMRAQNNSNLKPVEIADNNASNLNNQSAPKIADNSNFNGEKTAEFRGDEPRAQERASLAREVENDTDISLAGIKLHRENYILPASWNGGHSSENRAFETKFQISAKKALWEGASGASVNLAYTQTSWWQTAKASALFRETNSMPEIFTDLPLEKWLANGDFAGLPQTLRLGFLHQSNGKSGEKSRSWNRLYAQAFWRFGDFSVSPRFWARVREADDDNPGIENYAGRGDIELRYNFGRQYVSARIANNLRLSQNRGNIELGYVFPLFDGFYGYVQYFNGYAESMIDYDQHTNRIGVGFLVK